MLPGTSGTAGSYGNSMFNSLKSCQAALQSSISLRSYQQCLGILISPRPLQHCLLCLFDYSHREARMPQCIVNEGANDLLIVHPSRGLGHGAGLLCTLTLQTLHPGIPPPRAFPPSSSLPFFPCPSVLVSPRHSTHPLEWSYSLICL